MNCADLVDGYKKARRVRQAERFSWLFNVAAICRKSPRGADLVPTL